MNMTLQKRLFVTVGTTEFESLIKEVRIRIDSRKSPPLPDHCVGVTSLVLITRHETLSALSELGFKEVTLQIGRGEYEPKDVVNANTTDPKLPKVSYYRLKDSITDDIASADLVISHAGAGNVLDCLQAGKKLLVVINDELMGNHQTELAEKLAEDNHLHYCVVSSLVSSLRTLSWDFIKPFPSGQPEKLVNHLNKRFGFT